MDIKTYAKKVLAVLISLVLTISLLPAYSFADEEMENKDLTNTENTSSGNTEETAPKKQMKKMLLLILKRTRK